METISVIVLCYNEEEALPLFLPSAPSCFFTP